MTQDNIRTFADNWTGTGTITGSGDEEEVELHSGEYMDSEIVYTGSTQIGLGQNYYVVGDTVTLKYRTADTANGCSTADWVVYSTPFVSTGYVQVRIEVA